MYGMIYDVRDKHDPLIACHTSDGITLNEKRISLKSFGLSPFRIVINYEEAYRTLNGKRLELHLWRRARKGKPDAILFGRVELCIKIPNDYKSGWEVVFVEHDGIERAIERIDYV